MENTEYLFNPFPTFQSDRIYMRKLELFDAEDMFEYCSREEVSRFENWKPHKTIETTKEFLRWIKWQYIRKKARTWGVVLNSGKLIGTASFVKIDYENKSAEIGYTISNDYWGNGYAKEAAYQLIRFAFTKLGCERVYAKVLSGNERSVAVLQKLCFSYEGTARNANFYNNQLKDVMYFSLLKEEFYNNFSK